MNIKQMQDIRDSRKNAIGFLHMSDQTELDDLFNDFYHVSKQCFYDICDKALELYAQKALSNKSVSRIFEILRDDTTEGATMKQSEYTANCQLQVAANLAAFTAASYNGFPFCYAPPALLGERQPEPMAYMVTLPGGRNGSRLAGDYSISITKSFGAALQLKQFNRGHGLIQVVGAREGEFKTEMLRRKLTARGYSVRVINTITGLGMEKG